MESKYKWNYGRLTAFLVASGNMIFLLLISLKVFLDPNFLSSQLGLKMDVNVWIKLAVVFIYLSLGFLVNIRFIRKIQGSRLLLALVETLVMAFIIRNLFVGFLFEGVHIGSYLGNLIAFVCNGILIYHTLFSNFINDYYKEF